MSNRAWDKDRFLQRPLPPPLRPSMTDGDILALLEANLPYGMSRRVIATSFRRKVSPTLIAQLERLTAEGWLIREVGELPNKVRYYIYYFRVAEEKLPEGE